jgi:hypothetical protein
MERSRGKLVVAIVSITILLSVGVFIQASADTTDPGCHNGDCSSGTVAFKLRGLEIFKGIDIGSVRCGTTFIGRVFQYDPIEGKYVDVGYWKSVLCYTGAEFIEVCGGEQNILRFNLEAFIEGGAYAGNKLVLKIADPSIEPDVYWDSIAPICGFCISGSECDCPDSSEQLTWDCEDPMPEGFGPVATIPYLALRKGWGTTLDIEGGAIYGGLLCHNWFFIPRVGSDMFIYMNE